MTSERFRGDAVVRDEPVATNLLWGAWTRESRQSSLPSRSRNASR